MILLRFCSCLFWKYLIYDDFVHVFSSNTHSAREVSTFWSKRALQKDNVILSCSWWSDLGGVIRVGLILVVWSWWVRSWWVWSWWSDLGGLILVVWSWWSDLGVILAVWSRWFDLGVTRKHVFYQRFLGGVILVWSWWRDLGGVILVVWSWWSNAETRVLPAFWEHASINA